MAPTEQKPTPCPTCQGTATDGEVQAGGLTMYKCAGCGNMFLPTTTIPPLMPPTKEQIREQYLANQIFLLGEKVGPDLEVIDRRANYIVVVNQSGETSKLFLDEAFELVEAKKSQLQVAFGKVSHHDGRQYKGYLTPNDVHLLYHAGARFNQQDLEQAGDKRVKGVSNPRWHYFELPEGLEDQVRRQAKPQKFAEWTTQLDEGFTFKGYKPKFVQDYPEALTLFENLAKGHPDPYAVLSALKQIDIFFEKRTEETLERARTAIAKVDDITKHTYLSEELVETSLEENFKWTRQTLVPGTKVLVKNHQGAATVHSVHHSEAVRVIFDDGSRIEVPVSHLTPKIVVPVKEDTIKDEEIDFTIEEKLTYSSMKMFLSESFEEHVHHVLDHLEKNPHELDSLADHVKTIAHIAHHYDHHMVHMSEGVKDVLAGLTIAAGVATAGFGVDAHEKAKAEIQFRQNLQKTAPADHDAYMQHWDEMVKNAKDPVALARSKSVIHALRAKHKALTESAAEHKAIEHAEPGHHVKIGRLSSGPQLVRIAKRAAVELLAQKLANKPVKKISAKEKDVIIDAIRAKKKVVMKLARKLIPKIKRIELENHHDDDHYESGHPPSKEFGSAGS